MIYVISKLVTAFFLPPGLFITMLLVGAYFFAKVRKFLLFLALFIWLLSNHFVAKALLEPLENMPFPTNPKAPEAVVVLGGGYASKDPTLPLSASGTKRLLWGLKLAVQKNLPLIYTGYENSYAKKTLQTLIQAFNLPLQECDSLQKGCFIIEGRSKDTYENAKFTKKLFASKHPSIILVTSAFHMPRSYQLFSHSGFAITPSKCDYQLTSLTFKWRAVLPNMDELHKSYTALHEYLGLLSLKLRGI